MENDMEIAIWVLGLYRHLGLGVRELKMLIMFIRFIGFMWG